MKPISEQYPYNVFVFCFDDNEPWGGIKQLYHHVDILSRNGVNAKVLQQNPGFRCNWFENSTPVTSVKEVDLGDQDIVVMPEVLGVQALKTLPGIKKVIFNQNGFYTFKHYPPALSNTVESQYLHSDTVATMTVSQESFYYLKHAFPAADLFRIFYSVDAEIFQWNSHKKKQICYMPRKNAEDAEQVFNILKYRGMLNETTVIPIDGMSEQEVAKVMQESLLFISFGHPEGFGLPVAEAMLCGCVVVGYHGIGGREFFTKDYGYPMECGDVLAIAQKVEELLVQADSQTDHLFAMAQRACNFIRKTYSKEAEENSIIGAWENIFKLAARKDGKQLPNIEMAQPNLDSHQFIF
ncbi:MAG: glycosyltransferase [Cyanobacteria bacterium P01_C01_bin.89]